MTEEKGPDRLERCARPAVTNPGLYKVVFENERVRVIFIELKESVSALTGRLGPADPPAE